MILELAENAATYGSPGAASFFGFMGAAIALSFASKSLTIPLTLISLCSYNLRYFYA